MKRSPPIYFEKKIATLPLVVDNNKSPSFCNRNCHSAKKPVILRAVAESSNSLENLFLSVILEILQIRFTPCRMRQGIFRCVQNDAGFISFPPCFTRGGVREADGGFIFHSVRNDSCCFERWMRCAYPPYPTAQKTSARPTIVDL